MQINQQKNRHIQMDPYSQNDMKGLRKTLGASKFKKFISILSIVNF